MAPLDTAPTLGTIAPVNPSISFYIEGGIVVLRVKSDGGFEWAENAAELLEDDAQWQGEYGPLLRALLRRLWAGEPQA